MARLTRVEQKESNRDRVLEAAGKLFREKGFHGASVEEIADDAGFSRGVIYSQFGSKDDLFLALTEQRMEWRTQRGVELIRDAPEGADLMRVLTDQQRKIQETDVPWTLAWLEFRIHAARTPHLNARYAELHRKSIARLAEVFALLISKAGLKPRFEPAEYARFAAVLDTGGILERVTLGSGPIELATRAFQLVLNDPAGQEIA